MNRILFCLVLSTIAMGSCQKEKAPITSSNKLHFSLKFDPVQPRLNNLGLPSEIPIGNAAQTPTLDKMSIHYIELTSNAFTPLGDGAILYKGGETTKGGDNAVDFDKAITAGDGENFVEISLKDIAPGTYEWVRTSVTYQNYSVQYNLKNIPVIGELNNQSGTVASFVGFNTYISSIQPHQLLLNVNDDKKQGFWAFETAFSPPYDVYNAIFSGEAPAAATTVVNPLFQSSPIPAGSCVVTGKFSEPLVITGHETKDLKIILSFSINNSFEWQDKNGNGQLDFYPDDATQNEPIVDMGLRGLEPSWE